MESFQGILGIVFGYGYYHVLFKSKSRISKIPKVAFSRIELSPHFKIRLKSRTVHIHHWMSFPVALFILLLITSGFSQLILIKSFLIGATAQGFAAKDRFKIIHHQPPA